MIFVKPALFAFLALVSIVASASASTVADSWSSAEPLPNARWAGNGAVFDGKFYVFGGVIQSGITCCQVKTDLVEEYDIATNTWTNCGGSCPRMSIRRSLGLSGRAHIVNGRIYLIGGIQSSGAGTGLVEEFDPATKTFTNCGGSCASLPSARKIASTAVTNGKIYVMGGRNAASGANNVTLVEEYDVATDTWTNCGGVCAPMPRPLHGFSTATVDGRVYTFGGFDSSEPTALDGIRSEVYEFDPNINAWTNCGGSCAVLPDKNHLAVAAELNGKVYVIGGGWNNVSGVGQFNTVWEFDPLTNAFTNCGDGCMPMPTPRDRIAVGIWNNQLFAAGGFLLPSDPRSDENGNVDALEIYSPSAGPGLGSLLDEALNLALNPKFLTKITNSAAFMYSFINEIEKAVEKGDLTSSEAQVLIHQAESILELLE